MAKRSYEGFYVVLLFVFSFIALHGAGNTFAAEAEKTGSEAGKKAAATEMIKIGHVNLGMAMSESEAGKKATAEIETLLKTKQATLDEKAKTIEKMKGDLEKQASVLSSDARKNKEEEIDRLMRDFQRLAQDSQTEIKKKQNEITTSMLKEMQEIVDKIAKEENYSIIFESSGGSVLYSKKEFDITDKVIKKHNELHTKAKSSSGK